MSKPQVKDAKQKKDRAMRVIRNSSASTVTSSVTVFTISTASGTTTAGVSEASIPVSVNSKQAKKAVETLAKERTPADFSSASIISPPVIVNPVTTVSDDAEYPPSPPVLQRETCVGTSAPTHTVYSSRPQLVASVTMPQQSSQSANARGSVGNAFEHAYQLAAATRPDLDHMSLLAFAGNLLTNSAISSVSGSSSFEPIVGPGRKDVPCRPGNSVPSDASPTRRRRPATSSEELIGTQAKRRRADHSGDYRHFGDEDASLGGPHHGYAYGARGSTLRCQTTRTPVSVPETRSDIEYQHQSSDSPLGNDASDADDVYEDEDRQPYEHSVSGTADDGNSVYSDVEDADTHPFRKADLTAIVYRQYPKWKPAADTTSLPATGAAEIFGGSQAWVKQRAPSSLPHTGVITKAFEVIAADLRCSADDTDPLRAASSVSSKHFTVNNSKTHTSKVFPVHAPVFAADATVVEQEAESLGIKQPGGNTPVPMRWKDIGDIEGLLKNSLSNLSSVDCLSSTALSILRDNLAEDLDDTVIKEVSSLYMAMSEALQHSCSAIAMSLANLILAKRDLVIPTRSLPGESVQALRTAPVTSCHLFAKQTKKLQKDVESLQHLKQLRRVFEVPVSTRTSSSSSSSVRGKRGRKQKSKPSSIPSVASYSAPPPRGNSRGRYQRRGQNRSQGSATTRAQASGTNTSHSQRRV